MLFTGDGKRMSSCNLENVFFLLCFTIVLHFIFGASCVCALLLLVPDLTSENNIQQILSFQLHGSIDKLLSHWVSFLDNSLLSLYNKLF